MFCGKCGCELKNEDMAYCGNCGAPVKEMNAGSLKPNLGEKGLAGMEIGDKKKKRIIMIAALAVIAMIFIVKFCFMNDRSPESKLIGTWVYIDDSSDEKWQLSFNEDGKFYDSDNCLLIFDVGNWSVVPDGKLYLSCVGDYGTWDYDLRGNILTIYENNYSFSFKKIK